MEKYKKHCPEFYRAKRRGILFMIEELKMVMYCGSMFETLRMRAYKQELISYLKKYPTRHLKRSVRKEIREITSLDIDTTIKTSIQGTLAEVGVLLFTMVGKMVGNKKSKNS